MNEIPPQLCLSVYKSPNSERIRSLEERRTVGNSMPHKARNFPGLSGPQMSHYFSKLSVLNCIEFGRI